MYASKGMCVVLFGTRLSLESEDVGGVGSSNPTIYSYERERERENRDYCSRGAIV